ncbi:1-aminocyclopropane-1-carboxylate oxidase 1-like [Lotus japonicus]|uniref:1-aminocyclopropane-1-carboxylate oxidase 1-like n=1 Tax=Lotus japonicus TaxID=34305 RepID=UPI002585DA56|nr:1-aminocyclopropane-1-carboxylate oxidase 1-like [Lotus japonicus]
MPSVMKWTHHDTKPATQIHIAKTPPLMQSFKWLLKTISATNLSDTQIENHGIDKNLMEKVKQLINTHYEENLKQSFYESEKAKSLEKKQNASDIDWGSAFFIWQTMEQYIEKLIQLAEDLSGLMSENLGLEKDYIKKAFSGSDGPAMGTKIAKYPQCPNPELVRGLREHTDAGGVSSFCSRMINCLVYMIN